VGAAAPRPKAKISSNHQISTLFAPPWPNSMHPRPSFDSPITLTFRSVLSPGLVRPHEKAWENTAWRLGAPPPNADAITHFISRSSSPSPALSQPSPGSHVSPSSPLRLGGSPTPVATGAAAHSSPPPSSGSAVCPACLALLQFGCLPTSVHPKVEHGKIFQKESTRE